VWVLSSYKPSISNFQSCHNSYTNYAEDVARIKTIFDEKLKLRWQLA